MKPLLPLAAFILSLTLAAVAQAHAFLDHADPRVGSELDRPPDAIRIWFTESIEPAFSAIEVLDSNGKQIDNQDSHVDPGDDHLLVVTLPVIGPGEYKVVWHVVASDTHKTQGDYKFTVKAAR